MYVDRHMWVPIFFQDEFWAGMKSTQRSESMHAFFDKYITSKSSLIQFVRQYQNCLIDKEQKELECDADDLRGLLPCVSSSPIEKQFQKEYTNKLFQNVQEQFLKKANCFPTSVIHQGTSILCQVDQQRMVSEMSVYSRYQVIYCLSTKEIRCDCYMFESEGILCCHILLVLMQERVSSISSQYILPRWSKNISRKHTHIKCIQDANRSDNSMNILRPAIDSAPSKLKKHRESNREVVPLTTGINLQTNEECSIAIDEIRGPQRVPTRGRPSTTRLGAALDNSIKKSVRKRKHKHADEHEEAS